jgi:hypothetical protein
VAVSRFSDVDHLDALVVIPAGVMITFTSLSGDARSTRTTPLSYLLQVDDVRILLDCGSPDWCPEASTSAVKTEDLDTAKHSWDRYCDTLRECVHVVNVCAFVRLKLPFT